MCIRDRSYPIQMGVEYSPYTVARELQYATFYNLLKDERLLRMFDSDVYKRQGVGDNLQWKGKCTRGRCDQ